MVASQQKKVFWILHLQRCAGQKLYLCENYVDPIFNLSASNAEIDTECNQDYLHKADKRSCRLSAALPYKYPCVQLCAVCHLPSA